MDDTIAAISTALGVGGISIIRVSGPESIEIVNKITKMKKIINASSHTISYDHIIDNDKIVDEVLITVMRAPRTFTCEDVVEINAHGSIATTNYILKTKANPTYLYSCFGVAKISKDTTLSTHVIIQLSAYFGGLIFSGNICFTIISLILSVIYSGKTFLEFSNAS